MNLIVTILRLPFWAYFIAAGAIVFLGILTSDSSAKRVADIVAAQQNGRPAAVPLSEYAKPDQKFTEATITVQIVSSETTRLIDRTNGVKTGEDIMFALADPAATTAPSAYAAMMILSKREHEKFEDWAFENMVDIGALGPIIEINGSVARTDGEKSHAEDALADRNKSLASGAIFIEPFILQDRTATLASKLKSARNQTGNINSIAGFVALFGLGKLLIGRQLRSARQARQPQPGTPEQPEPAIRSF